MTSAMDNMITDEVIRRRLMIDGDGVGDDRKIVALMKAYVAYCTATKETQTERAATFRRLLSQLHQVEMSVKRTQEAITVNEESKEMFSNLKGQVQKEIQQTKNQIVESKTLLEEATKHRKYSMEYDALAKLIQSKPDRKGTEAKRVELEKELQILRTRQSNLDEKLGQRRQNLSMLTATIERLKELLKEEDEFQIVVEADAKEEVSPMEVDESPKSALCPSSPMEQVSQEASQSSASESSSTKIVSGTVTSAPNSPATKVRSEKYEDLSESDGEQD